MSPSDKKNPIKFEQSAIKVNYFQISFPFSILYCVLHKNCHVYYLFESANYKRKGPHFLGINYHVNFLGGIGGNEFHIKEIFGIQDN